jgi:MoaA/NifB/PqqE/SkfB family radical SAM enzyme
MIMVTYNLQFQQQDNSRLNDEETKLRKVILESTPVGLGIGAHFHCNAHCIFCLGGYPRFFSLEAYRKFFEGRLSAVISRAEFLNLCGFGELLLMPGIEIFLDYINRSIPQVNKILTTNGIPLRPAIVEKVTQSNYSIQVSLHASNGLLHRQLTKTDAFERILSQVEFLLSRRKNRQQPSVSLIFVATTLNIEDLPNFVKLAIRLGVDSVVCNYMTVYTSSHLKLSCFFKQRLSKLMFEEAQSLAQAQGLRLSLPPRFNNGNSISGLSQGCLEPWKYMYIETEGSVLPCCYAGNHIGYLSRDDFSELWNGAAYRQLRSALAENKVEGWCRYCYKRDPSNIDDLRSHLSFRPDLQRKILGDTHRHE